MSTDTNVPTIYPIKLPIISHDVGRTNDRSTAVVGGHLPPSIYGEGLLGVNQFLELPLGHYGSTLANAVAQIDQCYNRNCLILADLSNDPTYGETLHATFGPRVIGVQIGRGGDGTTFERRPVLNGAIPVYHVGRTFLLNGLLADLRDNRIRFADSKESQRAYAQLEALETELRESGLVYSCPPGQHDDLAISLAMLSWAAKHQHFDGWARPIFDAHWPRRPKVDAAAAWRAFT
jgi:hypothetical protein